MKFSSDSETSPCVYQEMTVCISLMQEAILQKEEMLMLIRGVGLVKPLGVVSGDSEELWFLLTVARHLQMLLGSYKVHNSISFVADGFKTFSSQ